MPTLTTNLFRGQGERDHRLSVVEGRWPDDLAGSVYVVGPDKREPGGHWFGAHGLLEQIRLRPGPDGRIEVRHRLVGTTVARIRRRLPFLFRKVAFAEVSPFGVTNFANTNVQAIGERLFLGFDAGRPVEVDPVTLEHLTPVGANDEWLQGVPGLLEPLVAVAAHPAPDEEAEGGRGALWFVNYTQVAPPDVPKETWLARWDLHGPVQRWRVTGMSPFDSIHDVKASRHHVVISDLPFVLEPQALRGRPRTIANRQETRLWIVAKADVEATPPGGEVPCVEVRLPMPTGHLTVDVDEEGGNLRVVLQHIPLSDLMISLRDGEGHPDLEGLIALAVQPSVIGRYVIDPKTGDVLEEATAVDVERAWGGVLATTDVSTPAARAHQRQLWYAGLGYDPEVVPRAWRDLYGSSDEGVVAPADLPAEPIPGSLARIDLDAMAVAEVWSYPAGSFPSPPTFVPRSGATGPDDGYVVVVVHRDGDKAVEVFDAMRIADGPVAVATAPGFNPNLMLHSCWMPDRVGSRPASYRVPVWRDVLGALRGVPRIVASMARTGRAMRETA